MASCSFAWQCCPSNHLELVAPVSNSKFRLPPCYAQFFSNDGCSNLCYRSSHAGGFHKPSKLQREMLLSGSLDKLQLLSGNASRMRKRKAVSAQARQKGDPLKVMIAGAPASGKGTQCELILQKHGLIHISAGDLLRAEIAAGTQNGKMAEEYMSNGQLVPPEIVVTLVKDRLAQPDVQEKGWLLDGYPRSLSQAVALETAGIRPDIFIFLDVPDEIIVERVVGRRLDPVTGKIYHLKFSPPEKEDIAARLTQRFDDTETKVKLRLQTHSQNVDGVLATYSDVIKKVDGNRPKKVVFHDIDSLLSDLVEEPPEASVYVAATCN
eukprot:c27442_g1_i3 orf=157-1125(+)